MERLSREKTLPRVKDNTSTRLAHGLSHEGDHNHKLSSTAHEQRKRHDRPSKEKRTTVTTKKRNTAPDELSRQAGRQGSEDFIHTCTLAFLGKKPHRPGSIALRFLKRSRNGASFI